MTNLRHRIQQLEEYCRSLPTFTLEEQDEYGFFLWCAETAPTGDPSPQDETLAHQRYLNLPPAQRHYWRNLGRLYLQYIHTHPNYIQSIFDEIGRQYGQPPAGQDDSL